MGTRELYLLLQQGPKKVTGASEAGPLFGNHAEEVLQFVINRRGRFDRVGDLLAEHAREPTSQAMDGHLHGALTNRELFANLLTGPVPVMSGRKQSGVATAGLVGVALSSLRCCQSA